MWRSGVAEWCGGECEGRVLAVAWSEVRQFSGVLVLVQPVEAWSKEVKGGQRRSREVKVGLEWGLTTPDLRSMIESRERSSVVFRCDSPVGPGSIRFEFHRRGL